jgi:putative membrane protein
LRRSSGVTADTSWTLEPGAILLVALLGALYVPRWRRVRADVRPGAGPSARAADAWRLAAFLGGLLLLVVALISPVDRLGEQAFSMHMVQHVLLLDLAPILFMLALTKVILRPLTRRMQRVERAAGVLAHPVAAVIAYVALMWLWHVPALYDAALESPVVHVLEHVCFLSVGLLYWWHLLSPVRSRLGAGGMGPVVYMLSTKLAVGLLGIGLTFAPDPLYDFYEQRPGIWGLSPTEDQAAAGAIMALEQSIIMGIALTYLFVRALTESEREQQRAEALADRAEALADRTEGRP